MTRTYSRHRPWPGSWLPEIPQHWSAGSFRHFANFTTGWTPSTGDDAAYSGDNPWANIADLRTRWISQTAKCLSDGAVEGREPSRVGDLLFAFKLSVGAVSRAAVPLYTNEAIATIRESDTLDLAYGYYALPIFLAKNANTNIYGAPLLNRTLIRSAAVALPPLNEQRAIADYLDRETARIDRLIEEQRRLVEILRERRHVACTTLATLGVGHQGPTMKTDLFWAREIPVSWTIVPLTSVATLESGHTPSRERTELWEDSYIPWISLNDVGRLTSNEYISSTANLISDAGIAASSARLLPADTVVLSRDATIGRSSIMAVPMATSQHFANWICGPNLHPRFLWLLFTSAMQAYFDSLTNGSTLRTIGMGALKAFRIPLPPMDQQVRIVEQAAEDTAKIDALIAETERFIELARERRSALITAAVTGQIDVTGCAA